MKLVLPGILWIMLSVSAYAMPCVAPASQPRRMNQDLALTKADISALIARAQAGDNKAAVKLAFYFDFYERDYDSATFWFKKAARNGDVKSEYNLGVRLLMQSKDPEKCREATFWLKMALANGMSRARRSLEELGPCP